MFLFKNALLSQTNLIKNSSLEADSNLQCTGGFTTIKYWDRINSVDYFTDSCYTNYRGVPINQVGETYPKHGIAYAGLALYYTHTTIEVKEYLYQHLTNPLKQDTTYCLSFFVSLADKSPLSLKQIGAYFTTNTTNTGSLWYIPATPQITTNLGFIMDTIGWTEIQGCFIAQGGEEFITIGNFNSNANTDTLFVGSTNPLSNAPGYAYYYIDSVSLYQNSLPTGIHETINEKGFKVYPNPANGVLNIDIWELKENTQVEIVNLIGELVLTESVTTQKSSINLHLIPSGIYFYRILVNGISVNTNKVVIIK